MAREPITILELDDEVCSLTFGVGDCPASLGASTPRKCYGTYATCPVKQAFDPVTRTLRYCDALDGLPKGGPVMFPVLRNVSEVSGTVNVAGSDPNMSAFGRRATISVQMDEFRHHDRGVDPYASERVTGEAQIDEPGYDPALRSAHFAKQRARNPYYAGRAMRLISAWLDNGQIVDPVTRHYVQTEKALEDDGKAITVEGEDVLNVAGNDKALAPKPSKGQLLADITAVATSATLMPTGIGAADYPTSGRACIGSEIVSFTRVDDVLTLTGRGLAGTTAAHHSISDSVQLVLHVDGWRMDDTIATLLRDFAGVPDDFLPLDDWEAEISRWMPQVRLRTHICKPEGVAGLVGELAVLGLSIWWDDVGQKVRLRVSRPPDTDAILTLTDEANHISVSAEDRQKDRLTEVLFFSVQIDPTKSATDASNYRRTVATYDAEAKGPNAFNDTKVRKIFCRWVNEGADGELVILSKRLLNRLRLAPQHAILTLDPKDGEIGLADVLHVFSAPFTDDTGKVIAHPMQVIRRTDDRGQRIQLTAQAYQFPGRYGYCTEDSRPDYMASTDEQRARGNYAVDENTMTFPDGTGPYRAI